MILILTREMAYAASMDSANRRMRHDGRCSWDANDYNLACATFNRLWPAERDIQAIPFCTCDSPADSLSLGRWARKERR